MKKYVESYTDFTNKIYEISHTGKEVTYHKEINQDVIKYTISDTASNDILEIKFVKLTNDLYERIFKINNSTTKLSNESSPFRKNVLKYVTYITNSYLNEYKPPVLLIIHMEDAMLSSEKRMKHNRLYLNDILAQTKYKSKIMFSDNTYATFLYENLDILNDIIKNYYDDIVFTFI